MVNQHKFRVILESLVIYKRLLILQKYQAK